MDRYVSKRLNRPSDLFIVGILELGREHPATLTMLIILTKLTMLTSLTLLIVLTLLTMLTGVRRKPNLDSIHSLHPRFSSLLLSSHKRLAKSMFHLRPLLLSPTPPLLDAPPEASGPLLLLPQVEDRARGVNGERHGEAQTGHPAHTWPSSPSSSSSSSTTTTTLP